MIPAGIFLLVVALLAGEAVVLWLDQIHRYRAEEAYWEARANRPDLYNWAEELDL